MAQIIKHRRGSLESISGATKRAGELLVVTGSSGITATNGNSILFVGIDGSTATPANKVLQGTSVPNLTGASYDTSVDGIPFYDTSAQKLYILNKGGNVEVKATAQTGGTGIVSGSTQVIALLPAGTVSGSSQITATSTTGFATGVKTQLDTNTVVSGSSQITITNTTGFSTFSGSIKTTNDGQDARITGLSNFTGSYATTGSNIFVANQTINANLTVSGEISASTLNGVGNVTTFSQSVDSRLDTIELSLGGGGSIGTRVTALEAFSGSQLTKDLTLQTVTASLASRISQLETDTGSQDGRLDNLELTSGSNNLRLNSLQSFTSSQEAKDLTLATYTASVDTRLNQLSTASGSAITRLTALEVETLNLESYTASNDTTNTTQNSRLNQLSTYTASNDTTNTTQNSRLDQLSTASGSAISRLNNLELNSGSDSVRLNNLQSFTSSQQNLNATFATTGSNIFFGTQTITGSLFITSNLIVQGSSSLQNITASAVSIGTNIVNLNTSTPAVRFGGISVQDSGSAQGRSGSLFWDSLNDHWLNVNPSGSIEGYNSAIVISGPKNTGALGNEVGLTLNRIPVSDGEDHIKDSQITDDGTTVSIPGNLSVTGTISGSIQGIGNVTTFSQSVDSRLDTIEASLGGGGSIGTRVTALEAFSGSQLTKDATLATYTASVDSRLNQLSTASGSAITRLTALEAETLNLELYTASNDTTNTTQNSRLNQLSTYTASNDTTNTTQNSRLDQLSTASGSAITRLTALEVETLNLELYTASNDTTNTTQTSRLNQLSTASGSAITRLNNLELTSASLLIETLNLELYTASQDTRNGFYNSFTSSASSRLSNVESFTSSINTTIKNRLDANTVVSGSSQVSYVGLSNIPAGIISGSSQLNNTTISGLRVTSGELSGSFSGSFRGDGSQLTGLVTDLRISGSTGNDVVSLLTDSLLVTGSNGISTAITNNTITISGVNASTSAKGVASFDADDFSVSTGNVSIKANGVRAVNLNADVAGTGLSLDGVDNSLEVDYGSTSGTAVEGNTSLTIQGTTHEIEISGGAVTLGTGGTVTIGLPNSVTIATASIQQNLSVGGNVNITGNLYVQGSTTTIDSTTIQLGDNIIELNGSAAANGGLLVKDATNPNTVSGSLLWNSTADHWMGGALGSEKQFARFNSTPTSGSVQVIGANGLLVNSTISDNGVDVTITNDLIISGLTANSFVVADGSKTLTSVAAVNAGDLIQWNGSSFVASNTIDGGTF
jgi:ubiquinone biosynthesis protein UbiJ